MFLSGIKFGMGFSLGTIILTMLEMAIACLSSWVSQRLEMQNRSPHRKEHGKGEVERERASATWLGDDDIIPA